MMHYVLTILLPILLTQVARSRFQALPRLTLPWLSAGLAAAITLLGGVWPEAKGDPVAAGLLGLSASGLYSGGGKALMGWAANAIRTQVKK